jgi:hypothetical protein
MIRRKNRRFSSPQRYSLFPNRYRVKDYLTNDWHYIENCPSHFIGYKYMFANKCFKTFTDMNCYINKEKIKWKTF